jgi:hypothetical protein
MIKKEFFHSLYSFGTLKTIIIGIVIIFLLFMLFATTSGDNGVEALVGFILFGPVLLLIFVLLRAYNDNQSLTNIQDKITVYNDNVMIAPISEEYVYKSITDSKENTKHQYDPRYLNSEYNTFKLIEDVDFNKYHLEDVFGNKHNITEDEYKMLKEKQKGGNH